MKGELLFREKQARDGYIREMVVWRLHRPVPGCRHRFKYRFFFGTDTGKCLVRYDNELGKGDHKYLAGIEVPYLFRTWNLPSLIFLRTLPPQWRMKGAWNERPEDRD